MIVKIQRSIYSADGENKMLVTDQHGNIRLDCPLSEHVSELLGENLKGFFTAHIHDHALIITGRSSQEDW